MPSVSAIFSSTPTDQKACFFPATREDRHPDVRTYLKPTVSLDRRKLAASRQNAILLR